MSYTAYHNGDLFFDTSRNDNQYSLSATKLDITSMSQGTFVFSVPPSNIMYDGFQKYTSYIDVYDNDTLIFCCRVADQEKDFDNILTVTCEGLMAIFADTTFEPFTYDGTLHGLVQAIVNNHNQQVTASGQTDKYVNIGTLTIDNSACYRPYEVYEKSISRLQDLNTSFGGYMRIRKGNGSLYLDWVSDYTDECQQSVNFGENLIDIVRDEAAGGFCTVLLPLGARQDDGTRLTIASVNGGSIYIEADAATIQQYGRIYAIVEWDDVEVASTLKSKAQDALNDRLQPQMTITVTAADLSKAGYDTEAFHTWQKIKATSLPHGIQDMWFNCNTMSIDFLNPESYQLTLGTTTTGYVRDTYMSSKNIEESLSGKFATTAYIDSEIKKLYYKAGDVIAFRGNVAAHTQTVSNQTQVLFTIPLAQPLHSSVANAKLTATITVITPSGRQNNIAISNLSADAISQNRQAIVFAYNGTTAPTASMAVVWIAGGGSITLS